MNTRFKILSALMVLCCYLGLVGCETMPSCNPERQAQAIGYAKGGAASGKVGVYNGTSTGTSRGCYTHAVGSSTSTFVDGEERMPVPVVVTKQSQQTGKQQPTQTPPSTPTPGVIVIREYQSVPFYGHDSRNMRTGCRWYGRRYVCNGPRGRW